MADQGLELTEKERALAKKVCHSIPVNPWDCDGLRTIILKLQAGKMKAEFDINHRECWHLISDDTWTCYRDDPCHTWTSDQWLEAAQTELSREGKG